MRHQCHILMLTDEDDDVNYFIREREVYMKVRTAKDILKNESIPYWRLAKALNVSESTVYRTLRDDEENLSCENEEKLFRAINEVNVQRHTGND